MITLSRLAGSITAVFLFAAFLMADPRVGAAGDVWISGQDIPTAPGEVTIGNSTSVVRTVTGKLEAGKRLSLVKT
jgi:hypothetical protein